MVKECEEEACIPPGLAEQARPVGTVRCIILLFISMPLFSFSKTASYYEAQKQLGAGDFYKVKDACCCCFCLEIQTLSTALQERLINTAEMPEIASSWQVSREILCSLK